MRALDLLAGEPLRRVLAIGCHADDLEIGCGATILSLIESRPEVDVTWVVLAAGGPRAGEARASAAAFLAGAAGARVVVHGFRDGFLPHTAADVKDAFEALKGEVDPHLILTHTAGDAHQDHRLACELTWNTWRDHAILEYEIPKVDGDLGRPNVYVPVDEAALERKIALLMEHFPTQAGRHWFEPELFRSLARLRGMECVSPSRYAEAFFARKLALHV